MKTTRGAKTTPFFVTRNEEAVSRERPEEWRLYRVFEFAVAPRIFVLDPPLSHGRNRIGEVRPRSTLCGMTLGRSGCGTDHCIATVTVWLQAAVSVVSA
ncbi:DUF3883 domain-containing protein [Methylorubrum sp. B1-46]|uniref:protein NO VEIN domain-containing protein n=1 Tax=Methylorubrum sp. B1-46 TaxID=2897334 RepID=UPI001E4AAA48|nr:DUF3883 domain-containing protein [Methylorubrum sp. B1-46]UGB27577.1 DUF3883 domain-containing protein [Methylorubrum sp. B1-46]